MPNLLGQIYSLGNSWRRSLVDTLSSPGAWVNRTAARLVEDSDAFQEKLRTAMETPADRSVLETPKQQKNRKQQALGDVGETTAANMAGAGIIVPVGALPGITRNMIKEMQRELDFSPGNAWERFGVHEQPMTGNLVKNISDEGQRIPKNLLIDTGKGGVALRASLKGSQPFKLEELVDLSRYPADLQEYYRSLQVRPNMDAGASFHSGTGTIGLGSADDAVELTSNLLHEMQHGAQYLYDMPRGGNAGMFYQDYGRFTTAQMLADQHLEKLAAFGRRPGSSTQSSAQMAHALTNRDALLQNPDALHTVASMLEKVEKKGHNSYMNIAGEVEARLVQELYNPQTAGTGPSSIMRAMGVNPMKVTPPGGYGDVPKVDADPITQALIDTLLGAR